MRFMSAEKSNHKQKTTPIEPNNRPWKKMDTLLYKTKGKQENQEKNTKLSQLTSVKHAHRWRIDEPNGETSMGKCNGCGEEKQFKNHDANLDFLNE